MTEEMDAATKVVVAYLAHDPVGNVEGYVTDYSPDVLAAGEAAGIIFIAEYNDGSREVAKAAEIVEPSPAVNGIKVVAPGYVDKRTDATIAVFDALAAIVSPEAAALDADGADGAAAGQADPVAAFADALAKLKAVAANGGDAGE